MTVDLDNTSNCPLAGNCVSCNETEDLVVATWNTPVGVICQTVCGDCLETKRLPRMSLHQAAELVRDHCGHLGIDLDEMAAIRDADEGTER